MLTIIEANHKHLYVNVPCEFFLIMRFIFHNKSKQTIRELPMTGVFRCFYNMTKSSKLCGMVWLTWMGDQEGMLSLYGGCLPFHFLSHFQVVLKRTS